MESYCSGRCVPMAPTYEESIHVFSPRYTRGEHVIFEPKVLDRYILTTRVSNSFKAFACWNGSPDVPDLYEDHTLPKQLGGSTFMTPSRDQGLTPDTLGLSRGGSAHHIGDRDDFEKLLFSRIYHNMANWGDTPESYVTWNWESRATLYPQGGHPPHNDVDL